MNQRVLKQASPTRIHSMFGLFPRALSELLVAVLPVLLERRRQAQERQPHRQRAVGGGRTRRLAPYQEVLLTLLYLRHNHNKGSGQQRPAQFLFLGISITTACSGPAGAGR